MSLLESKHYPLKTKYGVFYLKLTAEIDRNTEVIKSYVVNLGSRTKKCIQIRIPGPATNDTEGSLIWVEKDESCGLELFNKQNLAQHMTHIGLTVARKINPNLHGLYLYDDSKISCDMPDGSSKLIALKPFYFAFHGSTWYEEKFGAKKYENHDDYLLYKQKLQKPDFKPAKFEFNNSDLKVILEPLYKSTNTWAEFFKAIEQQFGRKKCAVVLPWLSRVPGFHIIDTPNWYIDFIDASIQHKIPMIEIEQNTSRPVVGGLAKYWAGTRKRRRNVSRKKYIHYPNNPNIPVVQEYDYKTFLKDKGGI